MESEQSGRENIHVREDQRPDIGGSTQTLSLEVLEIISSELTSMKVANLR
jgi:hypothetical protein